MKNYTAHEALEAAVLFKIYQYSQTSFEDIPINEIEQSFKIKVGNRRIFLVINELYNKNYIERIRFSDDFDFYICNMMPEGYNKIRCDLEDWQTAIYQYHHGGEAWLQEQRVDIADIPAADRIVSRSDNQDKFDQLDEQLKGLTEEIQTSNEVGVALGDDREVAVKGIGRIQQILKDTKIHAASTLAYAKKILGWIAVIATSFAVIVNNANEILDSITALLI